ncbi:hypothetical protein RJ640_019936 [Escallonia rubra]|uniref:DUF538 domain-containing protein n=1 Tax=Escallonia rubra TaxID=112253 RepID=A0AA88QIA0_9ASTE|nr:hypothetical protein RJ640_019936 [Escallonia rubra]
MCNYTLDGKYKLRYAPTITGVISQGKLEKLKGISVKALFFWVSVVEVQRNEEELVFITHIKSATFPVNPMFPPAILCVFVAYLTFFSASPVAGHDTQTAYEVLEDYDFPVGLLPTGVTGYELNTTTGKFKAYLNGTCSFSIDSYKLKYKSTISGVITTDKLTSLKGISVKVLLFWVNIVKVTRDDDELEFSVGIASADFPVDSFDESPQCGCGFDCDSTISTGEKMEGVPLNLNRFVFST